MFFNLETAKSSKRKEQVVEGSRLIGVDCSCLFPFMVTWRYQRLDKHRMVPPLFFFIMKNFVLFLFLLLPLASIAQYYNPYGSYQQQMQANQNAYNAGRGMMMYFQGVTALCEERFDDAYELFYEGIQYNLMNYEGLGVCNELGFGVSVDYDDALSYYKVGANKGNIACKQHLQRIKQSGFWTQGDKKTFLSNLRASQRANSGVNPSYGVGGAYGGNYGGSSGSSSSSEYTCPTCHGSGLCNICAGRGY